MTGAGNCRERVGGAAAHGSALPLTARPDTIGTARRAARWASGDAGLAMKMRLGQMVTTRVASARAAIARRLPILSASVRIAIDVELADRAAALALFAMLAAVPALLGALSAAGYLIHRLGGVTAWLGVGDRDGAGAALRQMLAALRSALPGVTWDPSTLATALVENRTSNGVLGSIGALVVGVNLVAQLDRTIRLVLGRPRRSALRSAGAMSLVLIGVSLLALMASFIGPLLEWGVRVVAGGFAKLSLGFVDSVALGVAIGQMLPIAIGFWAIVRWSAGRPAPPKRALWAVAFTFSLLWFCGQRVFSLYVSDVVRLDAIYGALTGVLALMLWLYYASCALLFAVAVLAALERHRDSAGA